MEISEWYLTVFLSIVLSIGFFVIGWCVRDIYVSNKELAEMELNQKIRDVVREMMK